MATECHSQAQHTCAMETDTQTQYTASRGVTCKLWTAGPLGAPAHQNGQGRALGLAGTDWGGVCVPARAQPCLTGQVHTNTHTFTGREAPRTLRDAHRRALHRLTGALMGALSRAPDPGWEMDKWGPQLPPPHPWGPHLSLCSWCVSGSRAEKEATGVPGSAPSGRLVRSGFSWNTGASLTSRTCTWTLAWPRPALGAAACRGASFCTSTVRSYCLQR